MKNKFVLIICLLISSQILNAQETSDTLKNNELEEISIRSVRANLKTPISEITLQQKQIEQGYFGQEIPVILSKTPSVTWVSDGGNYSGYSYFRLRGIDQTRINFTLNGVPLNEPEDQGAYFSNYPDFLNSIRSIQIQRGVGVSTNGTASFGGSINMESPSLNDSASVEINTSFGSFNTYRLSPEFNTGLLKNKWSFYGRFSATGSDGYREHSGTKGQSCFLSGGYKTKKGMIKFTGFTGVSNNQMAYLAVSDSILKQNYRANLLTKEEKDKFNQTLGMLHYFLSIGKFSKLSLTAHYTNLVGGYSILFSPDYYKFSVKSNFYGGIINYLFHKKRLDINVGVNTSNYVRYHTSSFMATENELFYKNSGHKQEFSSFVKIAYQLNRVTFFTDLQYRYTQFNYTCDKNSPLNISSINWHFFNPKAGVSYAFKKNHIIYSSIGKTSREPTRNDLFAGYDNIDSLNYMEIGSLSRVKPESVVDVELGMKLNFKKWKIDLNAYNMQFKNEIAAIGQLSYIGLPLRKNVASSYRRGIELNIIAEPIKNIILTTQANFSNNKIKSYTTDFDSITYTNVAPLLTPKVIVNQSVSYKISKRIVTEISGRYVSESFLDNTNNRDFIVPTSFILNGMITYNFMKQHCIQLLVNNLTNQKYYTAGYVQANQPYYFAMATRNFYISLKLKFQ
jgi:iron complex outermembrane receptor protein